MATTGDDKESTSGNRVSRPMPAPPPKLLLRPPASVDEVMTSLARPRVDMFRGLETAAMAELDKHFQDYKRYNRDSYDNWASRALQVRQDTAPT